MLSLQASMNAKIDPDWKSARYPYLRAVVIEGAEAIEHHGWKWWKKQDKDLPQLQMELIDIWHFLLSEILLRNDADETAASVFLESAISQANSASSLSFDGEIYDFKDLDLIRQLELLIAVAGARRIEVALFASIMKHCALTWDGLFTQYVGKNVLNVFRQNNGYKAGTYAKVWNGLEDNEHLVEIMNDLDADDVDYTESLYAQLEARYPG
ncbi:MAG: dUTP diphosphatase [Pseudohongiellaceae bacterium]